MTIQWYPGHMHKASKEIKAILPQIDVLIEVLDARIPYSSQNPMLAALRGDKPCIKVLTKSDLTDGERLQEWQDYLERERDTKTLALTFERPEKMRQLPELCRHMVPGKAESDKTIYCLIMGIPNVGKSTLINVLAGKRIAKTGNEPSITKMQQQIAIGQGIVLYDTPGVLWPKVENPYSGLRLAATGAIKDTAISHDQIAHFLAEFLLQQYSANLQQRFQFTELPANAETFLALVAAKRGCLRSGGNVDLDKVSKIILSEFRAGTLGSICLETPAMIVEELAELERVQEAKRLEKETRKQRWKQSS